SDDRSASASAATSASSTASMCPAPTGRLTRKNRSTMRVMRSVCAAIVSSSCATSGVSPSRVRTMRVRPRMTLRGEPISCGLDADDDLAERPADDALDEWPREPEHDQPSDRADEQQLQVPDPE